MVWLFFIFNFFRLHFIIHIYRDIHFEMQWISAYHDLGCEF